jgi:nucleotide-binding universal stress UspA family protein
VARVVVGVDGSPAARGALAWAAEESRLRGATLEVVYAYGGASAWVGMADTVGAVVTENFAEDTVDQAARSTLEGLVAEGLGTDPPPEVVLSAVPLKAAEALIEASRGADLVVVGSRGHGDVGSVLLGSVGLHCAHHAHCPVVIVRPQTAEPG